MIVNNICTCGHDYNVHGFIPIELHDKSELSCWGKHETDNFFCDCEEFVQDNLKYLEKKYVDNQPKL